MKIINALSYCRSLLVASMDGKRMLYPNDHATQVSEDGGCTSRVKHGDDLTGSLRLASE